MNTLTLATRTQAALFELELKGQISDGMWENTPGSDWETWCSTLVRVGTPVGRTGYVRKSGFAFERLIPIIGDRMIRFARLALAFPDVPLDDLYDLGGSDPDLWGSPNRFGGYGDEIRATAGRFGGTEAVIAAMNSVQYTERNLRADLRAIKAAMKTRIA